MKLSEYYLIENCSGIYEIKNIITGQKYIGKSNKIRVRLSNHLCRLDRNTHQTKSLQKDYNLIGFDNFEISILEKCETKKLFEREDFHIRQNLNLYNINNSISQTREKIWKQIQHKDIIKEFKIPTSFLEEPSKNIINSNINKYYKSKRKTLTLVSPEGKIITFTGLRKFCEENLIDRKNIHRIMNKISYCSKGWRVYNGNNDLNYLNDPAYIKWTEESEQRRKTAIFQKRLNQMRKIKNPLE